MKTRKNKRAKKVILILRISSTIFMVIAIMAFIFFASESSGPISVLKFFAIKLIALGVMIFSGWLGDGLSDLADQISAIRKRKIRESKQMREVY